MALVKKGSRLITVDGTAYRWRTRGRPTYDQARFEAPATFAVELAEAPGSVLVVTTPHPHTRGATGPVVPITPAAVASGVRSGLADGWRPEKPGTPHLLRVGDAEAVPS
ncbi:hypothetical protein [Actinorugispora endophytica]|uniref:Uncharacterized protein n=1 Tax=Actinorugispora endophytica TaxID=1605990 RepID=A0A4R6V451_9ACTN|nr:hypothetical protein [Actinorugispora endophytica]TDQ52979.1 hypothetical protein EV190_10596 [Actinorugispora endophytica]